MSTHLRHFCFAARQHTCVDSTTCLPKRQHNGPPVASLNAVARPRLKANINFRLTPELKKAANDRAEERGEDLSDVLRDALEKYVKKGKK
jgi:hypothetical protein